ncbi:MAG: hypothetical protein JWM80_1136 [Cyanobacteria bacterium RYN_339]|nr:hypothetical protein [Cyanobacteria bacterium RYN_339]
MNVTFVDRQILIDGRPDVLIGGEFQYFRIDRALWRPSLEAFKAAGMNAISAYVPWVWHEVTEGDFDFTGRTDPARDLEGFLALADELDLPLIIKPGPYIFAEYQGFGLPLWLQTNHPEILMQVSSPQDYPQPSINHPGYLALVKVWFETVAAVIRPYVERGRVCAIQVDNETGYPQYGQGPHMTDRNPATLALLREALQRQFSSVHELNKVWGTDFAAFDEVVPPVERLYNAAQLDTMARFVEDEIVRYLAALKAIWEAIGLPTFYFINDIWLDAWPSHMGKKNAVAPLAFDIYPRYSDLPVTFDQPFSISYVPKLFHAFLRSGPLICAEMGAGWLDPACTVSNAATWQSTMAAFAHGTQACLYYILQDGRDSDGDYVFRSFIGIDGEELPRMDIARRAARFCKAWGNRLAETAERTSPVAVLHYPAITREMMSAALDPVGMLVQGSHRAVDEALTIVSVNAGLYGALAEAGYNPRVLNLEKASPAELAAHEVIFFNSIGTVDPASQQKLLAYVQGGGRLVTLGTPFSEDSRLFPAKVKGVLNPRAWRVLAQVAWDYVKLYWRLGRQFPHKFCAYTIEGMYPAMLMTRHATRAGVWLDGEDPLWASRLVTLSRLGADAKLLLSCRGKAAGYEASVGEGKSVFVGTLLGASFDSPGFYLDDPARKRSVSGFLARLLMGYGLHPEVTPLADVETVVREGVGQRLAFMINRGPAKDFTLRLDRPWDGLALTDVFAGEGSTATWDGEQVRGRLEADDVLCLCWETTP